MTRARLGTVTSTGYDERLDGDERGARLELDSVLPVQLFARSLAELQPEARLQLAVLEDALRTFQSGRRSQRPRDQQRFAEDQEWFASDDTSAPFAFVTICDALDLDPAFLRGALRRSIEGGTAVMGRAVLRRSYVGRTRGAGPRVGRAA